MTLLKAEPCLKLMHSAVRTAIIAPLAGYLQVCVCVCFSSKVSSLTPFVSEGGLCVCARVCSWFVCVSVYTQHLSFMCLFVFLCDTSYPHPFILFYLFYSSITVLLLSNYILSPLPRLGRRGGVANRRTILHVKCCECDSGPLWVPCCRPALESSSKAVNPSQPRGCFCFSNSVWGAGGEWRISLPPEGSTNCTV